MKKYLFGLLGICLVVVSLIKPIDRTPYQTENFYISTLHLLDSIEKTQTWDQQADSLLVGYSKISITPDEVVPLAGYGARDPKEYEEILDSCFVRTLIFNSGGKKVALIMADLLLIHPEVRKKVEDKLSAEWKAEELFFTATHTHSGHGGWAEGIVGELFAGDYDSKYADFIADGIVESVRKTQNAGAVTLTYAELAVANRVKNRLVGEKGTTDPWLKVMSLQSRDWKGVFTTFSAHSTCFGSDSRGFTGDYPSRFCQKLETGYDFAGFAAGAVASMAPMTQSNNDSIQVLEMANDLVDQVNLIQMIGAARMKTSPLRSFRVPIRVRPPIFKISENLALRPWVFRLLVEESPVYISVIQIGDVLLMGFPCDFSGELALPLYEAARESGLQLLITSFNGGYIGYVPKDDWYNLNKYETRTMSWYGHDTGAYFSEIANRILQFTKAHD